MLFGSTGKYTNPRSGNKDPYARSRLVALGIFLVLILACLALAPSMLRIFSPKGPSTALIPKEHAVDNSGTPVIDITNIQGLEDFDPEEQPAPIDPLVPPDPFIEKRETLAAVVDEVPNWKLNEEGLDYLFHRIRTDPNWSNENGVWDYGKSNEFWLSTIKEPMKMRGKEVVLQGILVATEKSQVPYYLEGFRKKMPSGVSKYFSGYLHNGEKYFRIAFFEEPKFEVKDRAYVRMKGLFLNLYQNDVVHKGVVSKANIPVIVGSELSKLPPRESPTLLNLIGPAAIILLSLFFIVLVACLTIFSKGDKKYSRELKETRQRLGVKRKRVRIGKGAQAQDGSEEDSPDSSSETNPESSDAEEAGKEESKQESKP